MNQTTAATVDSQYEPDAQRLITISIYQTTDGKWIVAPEQNPIIIPGRWSGTIQWKIASGGATFPQNAPVLFDNGQNIPDDPPAHPETDTTCSMTWTNTDNSGQPMTFTYYAFVQVGENVIRVDPTVQNQPPGT